MTDFRVAGTLGADVSNFLRDLRKIRTQLQGVKDDVAELNRQLDDLDGKNIKIKVDIDGHTEIRELRNDLDRLSRDSVNIKVKVDIDADDFYQLRSEVARLGIFNQTITIKVEIDGMADLDRLYIRLRAMTSVRHTIHVDVDGVATSIAQLTALRAAISAASSGAGGLSGGLDAAAEGAEGAEGAFSPLIGIMIALIPLVSTLAAVLAGVAAGLLGSFGTLAAGIGAFALFAIPTIKKVITAVQGGSDEISKLPKPLQLAADSVMDLKERFKELSKELEPVTLVAFAEALNFARAGMEGLFRAAKPAGTAIAGLFRDAAEGLQGPEWQSFFTYVAKNIGFFITTWGHAIGNFVTGIANMIRAFDPLSKFVSNGFLGMSESFRAWTETLGSNKKFQEFVSYVVKNGPLVMSLIGGLFKVLIELGVGLAPAGASLLSFITQVAGAAAAFLQANPEFAKFLGYALPLVGALIALYAVMSGLIGVIGAFTLGTAGLAAGILAIVGMMVVWWQNCASFRDFVKEFWGQVQQTFQTAVDEIKAMIADWLPAIIELWNKYGKSISTIVMGIWTAISGIIEGGLKIIRGIVNVILGLLTGDWRRVWSGIKQICSGAWTALKGVFKGGIKEVEGELRGLLTAIGNIFKSVGTLLYKAGSKLIGGFISGIKSQFNNVKNSLGSLTSSLTSWKGPPPKDATILRPAGRLVIGGFMEGIQDQVPKLRAQLMSLTSSLPTNAKVTNNYYQPKQTGGYMAASMMTGGGVVFNEGAFKIYNPTAEAPSDSANRTMTRISRFGILEGVGS